MSRPVSSAAADSHRALYTKSGGRWRWRWRRRRGWDRRNGKGRGGGRRSLGWAVGFVPNAAHQPDPRAHLPVIGVIPGASAGPYVRLRGAYGRYLVATNYGAGRGPSDGVVAEQRDLGVRPTPPGYLWQAFRRRDSFVLRNGAGRYLRANGRFRRWHKDVSVAGDNASTMMQWRVEVLMHRTNPPVESDLSRVIRYVRADNAGRYGEQEWAPVRVNTNNLTHLRLTMAERLGQNCDAGQITLCVRAGRYAHLSPLLVDLPMGNNPIHIVVLNHGTPGD
uniref:DUF569 domain-containing protein n=1 Tax=Oryza barthii TaxID=65489 RepID=A0A0D3G2J2_9ORYZ